MVLVTQIQSAFEEYSAMGFDTLPLRVGAKEPIDRGWPKKEPHQMWMSAPKDANIGIRCGGEARLAVLDCDDKTQPGTFDAARRFLAGLGYLPGDYPVVQTASGVGRHIYVVWSGGLPGNSRVLSREFGAGEFRYGPGAFVAAPPSIVQHSDYRLIEGNLRQLPHFSDGDLTSILPSVISNIENLPRSERGDRAKISRYAWRLLHGENLGKFNSRSETEESLILSLVNSGLTFVDVLKLFENYPCAGKFAELKSHNRKNAERWLRMSYENAETYSREHETPARSRARTAKIWAMSRPWPGKGGLSDRNVFIAHMAIMYRAGRVEYQASSRDLALIAGVSSVTASAATIRLRKDGLLVLEQGSIGENASIYRLGHNLPLPSIPIVREWKVMSSRDAFRRSGVLGKSAGQIYDILQDGPLTINELAKKTGRAKKTVRQALERMAHLIDTTTGELIALVKAEGDVWSALSADLDLVERVIGTSGLSKRDECRYQNDRRDYRKILKHFQENQNAPISKPNELSD